MAKNYPFSNPALKQKNSPNSGFNLVPKTTNFNSVFDVKPLEESEASLIENLLVEGASPETFSESQVHADINLLKGLTAEIKAIGKQGILLMGQRVCEAREILKSYQNGTFTKWLDSTFGSKKTGYNLLTYYDFYTALPDQDLKEKFRKLPQQAAYILASRQGDMKKKEEIVRNFIDQKRTDLISLIHEKLPIKEKDKRGQKDRGLGCIIKLKDGLKMFFHRKKILTHDEKISLETLREMIDSILLSTASKKTKSKK